VASAILSILSLMVMGDMTHCYVWRDSFVCVTWLIVTCDVTRLCVWHDSLLRVTWLVCVCDMSPSGWLWWSRPLIMDLIYHVTRNNESCHTHKRVKSHVTMSHVTHYHQWSPLIMDLIYGGMGWLRLVGSLKLWVSFAKEPYKRDCVLQKRPIILRSLIIVATP